MGRGQALLALRGLALTRSAHRRRSRGFPSSTCRIGCAGLCCAVWEQNNLKLTTRRQRMVAQVAELERKLADAVRAKNEALKNDKANAAPCTAARQTGRLALTPFTPATLATVVKRGERRSFQPRRRCMCGCVASMRWRSRRLPEAPSQAGRLRRPFVASSRLCAQRA
jgi:hypothetical protein